MIYFYGDQFKELVNTLIEISFKVDYIAKDNQHTANDLYYKLQLWKEKIKIISLINTTSILISIYLNNPLYIYYLTNLPCFVCKF